MSELPHRIDPWLEKERYDNGLVTIRSDYNAELLLQLATLNPSDTDDDASAVVHNELVNRIGYVLRPYTYYSDKLALLDFGDSLVQAHAPHEEVVGMYSDLHAADVASLEQKRVSNPHGEYRFQAMENARRAWTDILNFTSDLQSLRKDGIDTWVRLAYRHPAASSMGDIVVAKLVALESDRNHDRMIPIIKNHDNSVETTIPRILTFGEPWLYVGTKTDNP